jgi:hypothetical protein
VIDPNDAGPFTPAGTVMKAPLEGGTPVTLASAPMLTNRLVVDSVSAYWTTWSGTVLKVPLGGGEVGTIASMEGAHNDGIAVDATSVYWAGNFGGTTGDWVMRSGLDGGDPVTLATGLHPYELSIYGGDLFWTTTGFEDDRQSDGTVMRMPLDGGAAVTLASPPATSWLGQVVATSTGVYWAEYGGGIMKMGLDGGTPVTLVSNVATTYFIAVDDAAVYYGSTYNNCVMKVGLDGGTPVTLASPGAIVRAVAVDAKSVYWTTLFPESAEPNTNFVGTVAKVTPK